VAWANVERDRLDSRVGLWREFLSSGDRNVTEHDEGRQGRPSYTFRKAYEGDAFQQADLLTWEAFGRQAKHREIDLSFGSTLRSQLEDLDRSGALRPLAFEKEDGEILFREEVDFAPWDTYEFLARWKVSKVLAYYSHWQLLYLHDAREKGRVSVRSTGYSTTCRGGKSLMLPATSTRPRRRGGVS
jgi:hypothetical protein